MTASQGASESAQLDRFDGGLSMVGRAVLAGAGAALSPRGKRARLSVLIYHQVLAQADALRPGVPDAQTFDWQMRLLGSSFNVVRLSEGVRRLRDGSLPARSVCVTFDDGYADNREVALPILQRYGLGATFFVAVGFLDGGRMFNDAVIEAVRQAPAPELDLRDAALGVYLVHTDAQRVAAASQILGEIKSLSLSERMGRVEAILRIASPGSGERLMMTSAQVVELARAGMEIGGHTVNHPILASVDTAEARREIEQGKADLETLIEEPVRAFAYPNGRPHTDYRSEHVDLVAQAGFELAVSTARGVSVRDSDPFQLPRFTPWDATPGRFGLRLLHNCLRTAPARC